MGSLAGWIWYHLFPIRVATVKENLDYVYGDSLTPSKRNAIARESCRQLAMNIIESFTIPNLNQPSAKERFQFHNLDLFEEIAQPGKGACVVSLHMGNFELAIAKMACLGFPIHIIYREISWAAAHDFWNLVREQTGIRAISHRRSKDRIKEVLTNGEYVGFASDQHMPPHRGVVCEFMGRLASTTPAASRFAIEANANIILTYTLRSHEDPSVHHIYFEPFELELPHATQNENIYHNTQRLSDWMGKKVREHPEQWLWQHKRFKVKDILDTYHVPEHLKNLI